MSQRISHTSEGDAPLSSAKNPDTKEIDAGMPDDSELIGKTITINKPRLELYAFWRNFENLAKFMENIESISVIDDKRSHWIVRAPAGKTVWWNSEIVAEVPGEMIAWRSTEDAQIKHSGSIEFRDAHGGRGTEITATILYDPPAGSVGKMIAKLFQREPRLQTRRDLRRLKQLIETGEIATSAINRESEVSVH